jgi:hypothetical protein
MKIALLLALILTQIVLALPLRAATYCHEDCTQASDPPYRHTCHMTCRNEAD